MKRLDRLEKIVLEIEFILKQISPPNIANDLIALCEQIRDFKAVSKTWKQTKKEEREET